MRKKLVFEEAFQFEFGAPKRFDSRIVEPDGTVVFEQKGVEAPEGWSQLAVDIVASKYFRRAGLFGDPKKAETSVYGMVNRVTSTLASRGVSLGYFDEANSKRFESQLSSVLMSQTASFNSPVWFNLGLKDIYGIDAGSGGNYVSRPALGTFKTTDDYSYPQCSACFIQGVDDSMTGIFDLVSSEARLFKHGSGSGTNFSTIRGKGEKLSSGGSASGVMSFLGVLDRAASATKSGGTTRRAAKMVVLDADHPEIEDFIEWKVKEEKKAQVLIAAGYASDFNGEAYKTVSGQNSNNSVRVSDAFMRAVENDGEWSLVERKTGDTCKVMKTRELWGKICSAAWKCADPGIQFSDTINSWHTCPEGGPINASNPCSEYVFLDETACNLSSLNLTKFLESDGTFNTEKFKHVIRLMIVAQDILVSISSYPTRKIAEQTVKYRTLGLGYANLGAMLMRLGLAYDSDEARAVCSATTALMTGSAYAVSSELAETVGAFEGFSAGSMCRIIDRHTRSLQRLDSKGSVLVESLLGAARAAWTHPRIYRNAQVTVLAPTGTIGLMMDCDTTGIEPDFSLVKYKKLAGGGVLKIVNQSVEKALVSLKYGPASISAIVEHVLNTGSVEGSGIEPRHLGVFDCAVKAALGGRAIRPKAHVLMMAAAQPFLSGAISKTVNLPNDATVEDVAEVYMLAWKLGLKAVALYRDGCKASQPLNVVKDAEKDAEKAPVVSALATADGSSGDCRRRLPKRRAGFTQELSVAGHKLFVRTGEYDDGTLGEIFLDMHKDGAALRSLMNCFAISVSMGLQYGVPLERLVERFSFVRFEPQGPVTGHESIKFATSIIDAVFRVLGAEYLKRTDFLHVPPLPAQLPNQIEPIVNAPLVTGDSPLCDGCGHHTVRNGTCFRCLNCGSSLGCS